MPQGIDGYYYNYPALEGRQHVISMSKHPYANKEKIKFKTTWVPTPKGRIDNEVVRDKDVETPALLALSFYREKMPYSLSFVELTHLMSGVIEWFGLSRNAFVNRDLRYHDYVDYRRLFVLLVMTYYPNTDILDIDRLMATGDNEQISISRLCQSAIKLIAQDNDKLQIFRQMELVRILTFEQDGKLHS